MTVKELQKELMDISNKLIGMTIVLRDATYSDTACSLYTIAKRLKEFSELEWPGEKINTQGD